MVLLLMFITVGENAWNRFYLGILLFEVYKNEKNVLKMCHVAPTQDMVFF